MPPKKPAPRSDELFRSQLDNMIDIQHALVKLARLTVANGMQLGAQATFGAPDAVGNSPFLSRLAAVRCAFK